MLSQVERFVFIGSLRVSTYYNYFPNDIPTAFDLFTALKTLHDQGKILAQPLGNRKLKISHIEVDNVSARLLFRLSDPDIPDQDLTHRDNGALRTAARLQHEDPTVSAHVVVRTNSDYDASRAYPCAIENIDFLSRSLIVGHLNDLMAQHMVSQRPRPKGDVKPHHPKVTFSALPRNTIAGALEGGSVLKGIKWRNESVDPGMLGDNPHHLYSVEDVHIKVTGKPNGNRAADILRDTWARIRGSVPRKVLVQLEDENGKIKSVMADTRNHDILANFFIPQELLGPFSPAMAMCQPNIRSDLVGKMLKLL